MDLKQGLKRFTGLSSDRYSLSELLIYVAAWGIVFLFPVVEGLFTLQSGAAEGLYRRDVFNQWLFDLPFLLLFIVNNRFIFPWLGLRQRMAAYIAFVVVLTLLVMGGVSLYDTPVLHRSAGVPAAMQSNPAEARQGLPQPAPWQQRDGLLPPADNRQGPYRPPRLGGRQVSPALVFMHGPFVMRVLVALLMLSFNIAVKFYFKSLRDKAAMWKMKMNNMQTELDYLKYQINPHFFMNTLNNIHALVDIDTVKAQRMIVEFSNLMRYLLYETNSPLIPLSKEMQFLRNYMELMRIRYTENVRIDLSLPDDTGDVKVPPLLFISFVENAFKHGMQRREEAWIDIRLQVAGGKVSFECANSSFGQGVDQCHGIGLENIRKRLELIYGGHYKLDIGETDEAFHVTLTVPAG